MSKRMYISGKITGCEGYEKDFKRGEELARLCGFRPVNPIRGEPKGKPWEWYMKRDIKKLLSCDAILLLETWEDSRGARLEAKIARELGKTVYVETPVADTRGNGFTMAIRETK